jgi:tetratricopeptide (TPR) repeat protein
MKSRYEEAARFAPVDENMGKLYGSIAQNYGFCGPEHLDATIQSAKKAMRCFGGDQGPKSAAHQDRQRQLNYMIYAYLDAGRWEDAEKKLMDYLEIEALDAAYPLLNDNGMDKFHHAVLARFFADCGSDANCKRFFDIVYPKRQMANKDHPWQLWAFNLGRIAETIGRKTEAGELYRESLMICLLEPKDSMDQRTTIVTMALLPLSRLRRVGAISDDKAQRCIQRARHAAAYLNPKHFRTFLDESDVDNALALVCQHPETFFPFTYR